jgi:signal transduction histidine kinase
MLMQKYTRAEEVNMLVLQLAQRLDMKDAIASSYSVMSQLCRLSGNKACAIDAANKAWMIYHQDGNQLEEIMMLYNLSDLYLSLGRYGEAAAKGMKSLGQAEAIGFYPVRKDIYRVLSAAYDSMRNPGQALRFYKLGAQLNDSLYRDEKIRKMAKMDSIYQTERRQKEMELKESQLAKNEIEIKQQKTLTFSFMGGLALVLVFAMFVLYSLRKSAVKNRQLRAANAKIQRTTAELIESEKKAFISDLVAGLAHDLKTPVGNVMLSSDTIRYESDDISRLMSEKKLTQSRLEGFSKKVHESGDLIYAEMQRVSEWIKGFQSINADQVKTDSQNIHLCEYLRTCMKTLDFKLRSKKISYVVEGPQELKVKVMPGFISQVVINLINNAVEHGFEDLNRTDKTIWLKVSHDEGSGMVTCACGNNGRPIPEEIMPRIFNDYFSTKKSGIKGMGLSSVKRLVEQGLGGKIECHSAEGEGVTFTFEFPLHKPSEERT